MDPKVVRLSVIVFAALALAAVAETVYKWVDERGVTHYSASPPKGGKAVEIKADDPPPPPSPGSSQPIQKTTKEVLEGYQKDRAAREEAQKKIELEQAVARAEVAARRQRCIQARQNSYVLQQPTPVFRMNERGERVYLDDTARAAELERFNAAIKRFCDP
jgi:Domain of unknown function (DUF4124)